MPNIQNRRILCKQHNQIQKIFVLKYRLNGLQLIINLMLSKGSKVTHNKTQGI